MTTFRICIAGRNHAAFTEECVRSCLEQEGDVVIDWTDDASDTNEALDIAVRLLGGNGAHRITQNLGRKGGLENLWRAMQRAEDEQVDVIVGGDDKLAPGAIARLRRAYEDPECWLTYGTLRNSDNTAYPIIQWKGEDPRNALPFFVFPLTCRAWLAKKVFEEDLQLGGGWFLPMGGDVGLNIPLAEMAGHDRAHFIEEPWFVREIHPGNDHTTDSRFQDFCGWMALCKPRYSRLASREDAPVRTPHLLRNSIIFTPQHANGHYVAY